MHKRQPGDVQNAERLNDRCAKQFCNLQNLWDNDTLFVLQEGNKNTKIH